MKDDFIAIEIEGLQWPWVDLNGYLENGGPLRNNNIENTKNFAKLFFIPI